MLILLIFSLFSTEAQQVSSPAYIIDAFKKDLGASKLNNADSLPIYTSYLNQLIARGNYIQADSIFNSIRESLETTTDSTGVSEIFHARAYMYKVQNRYAKSLQDYLWLKSYYERKQNTNDLIRLNIELSEYYRSVGLYDLCKIHLDQAEELFEIGDPTLSQLAYWNSRKAAWNNESADLPDSVIYYAQRGLELAIEANDIQTQGLVLNELGYAYMSQFESEELVMDYFNRAKDLFYDNGRYRYYVDVMNNIARFYYSQDRFEESLPYVEAVIPIEEANQWYESLQWSLERAYAIYQIQGRNDEYLAALNKFYEAKLNKQTLFYELMLSDNALNYEKELANKESIVQAERALVAESEAKINRQAFYISLSIALLLLLIVFISFYINLRFRRKNEQLRQKSNEIRETNDELEKSLSHQRALYHELNHRVKNNLSILTGLIYLQEAGEANDQSKEAFETLRNRVKSMALAHENLYKSDHQNKIDFQKYLSQLFEELKHSLSDSEKIRTEIKCDGYELEMLQAVPVAMVLNEFFTNSIKHAFDGVEKGIVSVKASKTTDETIIEYSDNGCGYSQGEESNTTLGLRLVKLLMQQLKAKFEDLTTEKGVSYRFTIPKADYTADTLMTP